MLANFSNLITFSRGSNATVTDASGRLTYAPHNLVTNSQDFEASAWTKTAASITANSAVAPDGTTTADTITEDTTAASAHRIFQTPANPIGPVIASVYVKAGTRSWFYIRLTDSASVVRYAYFNVSTGVLGTVDAGITASITPAGNGWYRCSAFINAVNSTVCVFAITDANGNPVHNGNGTGTLSLWGAQLEAVTYQTTPSPYVSTSVANLLGFSEAFDNAAWTKLNAAIVPNAAQNPINGLWNAQKLMENTANGVHYALQAVSVLAIPYTLSTYAKAGERSFLSLGFDNLNAWFNLSTGTVGTVEAGLTASITSVGNGWYRCAVSRNVAAAATRSCVIYPANANGNVVYTGDGNSGIYIYGAQLSNSGSLDPYVPTPGAAPSSTAYYGPRFDYDPVTLAAKGILIEEQRTNLLVRSEEFNNASWTANTSTVSPNVAISPDGTQDADRWVSDPGSTSHYLGQSYTSSASISYTFSVWVKSATGSNQTFRIFVQSSFASGDLTASTSWQRFTITLPSSTAGSFVAGLTRNGSNDPVDLLVYGAQLEAGAFATSYIPTVASQVTRSADVASISGSLFSQWYRQDEGTLVAETTRLAIGSADAISASLFTDGNNTIEAFVKNADNRLYAAVGGAIQVNLIDANKVSAGVPFKTSAAYRLNDYAMATGGGTVLTDTSATVPTATTLGIGSRSGSLLFNGYIRNITYIPNRISNDQLQAATT